MAADDAPLGVEDGPFAGRRSLPGEERRVIAVGHEADFMAIRLARDLQSQFPGNLSHRRLLQCADGEQCMCELRLRQSEKEVRLILVGIDAP